MSLSLCSSNEMFCKVYVLMGDISPIIMYYCNFPLSYIFVKSQMIYRTQKVDFDLHSTSIIYIQCKADVIYDTEGLRILCIFRIFPYSVRKWENRTGITPNTYTLYAVTVNQNLRVVNRLRQLTLLLLLLLIGFEKFKAGTVPHSVLK